MLILIYAEILSIDGNGSHLIEKCARLEHKWLRRRTRTDFGAACLKTLRLSRERSTSRTPATIAGPRRIGLREAPILVPMMSQDISYQFSSRSRRRLLGHSRYPLRHTHRRDRSKRVSSPPRCLVSANCESSSGNERYAITKRPKSSQGSTESRLQWVRDPSIFLKISRHSWPPVLD